MLDLHVMVTHWAARKSKFPFGSTWSDQALFDKAKKREMMTLRHDRVSLNTAAFTTGAQTNEVKLDEVERARKKKENGSTWSTLLQATLASQHFPKHFEQKQLYPYNKGMEKKTENTSKKSMINKMIATHMANKQCFIYAKASL